MIKYDFPDNKEWKFPGDAVSYFSYFLKEKNGKDLPNYQWARYCKHVKEQIKDGYSYEDMKYLLWGVFNFKEGVRSLNYCFYFWDNLNEYKTLKDKVEKLDKQVEKIEYKEAEKEESGEDVLGEFL